MNVAVEAGCAYFNAEYGFGVYSVGGDDGGRYTVVGEVEVRAGSDTVVTSVNREGQ